MAKVVTAASDATMPFMSQVNVSLRMSEDLAHRCNEVAAHVRMSRGQYIRLCIAYGDSTQTIAELEGLGDALTPDQRAIKAEAQKNLKACVERLTPVPLSPYPISSN